MAVPSGTVAMSNIQSEFGDSYNINNYYRGGSYVTNHPVNAGIPTSGTISMLQFRSASYIWYVSMSVTNYGGFTDFNMHSYMTANYGNSNGPIYATTTLNTGSAMIATSTSSWGFTTGSGWPSGSSLTFNISGGSYVTGQGGNGGAGNSFYKGSAVVDGSPGGPAIYLLYPLTINNGGFVNGGGGGGGGGAIEYVPGFPYYSAGGGGGGGGDSIRFNYGGTGGIGGGAYSGGLGTPGGDGVANGGAGGAGGGLTLGGEGATTSYAGPGGPGGGWGSAGSAGGNSSSTVPGTLAGAGGAAGYAIQKNGYTLSGSTGTTAGPIG